MERLDSMVESMQRCQNENVIGQNVRKEEMMKLFGAKTREDDPEVWFEEMMMERKQEPSREMMVW